LGLKGSYSRGRVGEVAKRKARGSEGRKEKNGKLLQVILKLNPSHAKRTRGGKGSRCSSAKKP